MRLQKFLLGFLLALTLGFGQAFGQASQILPGEQCFQAGAATSGGTVGLITAYSTIVGGSSYVSGTYANVPLTGGSGQGATATITVSGGVVTAVAGDNPGFHYAATDVLSASNVYLGNSGSGFTVAVGSIQGTGTGMVGALGTLVPGSGGTVNGTFGGVPLTGGTGSGATASITVAGGVVTSVAIQNPGVQYSVGDKLSASASNIGGVSGFSIVVNSVSINSSLAGGYVYYYIPNTLSFKQTWQNASQTILNQNPVLLDANGCAIVYGAGTYRQILQDSLGNTVWDQLTTAISTTNPPYWANLAGGTANAITVTDTSFTGQDGAVINFIAANTNTGAATLNPSSYGAIPIVKDTSAGPVPLVGSEIVASNIVSVQFSATNNNFTILNNVIQSSNAGGNTPLCGASGLKIINGTSPSVQINITARALVTVASTGQTQTRSNVSVTLNISNGTVTSAANGMDGEAPGTSAWVDIFAIDNGTAAASLGSAAAGNGLNPALPTGYTYVCYLGAMRVDSSGNLLSTQQLGNKTQYVVKASGNTTALPAIANGAAGTYSFTAPTYAAASVANFVPPTATRITIIPNIKWEDGTTANIQIAPNTNYGGQQNSNGNAPWYDSDIAGGLVAFEMSLESTSIYWASSAAGGAMQAAGWTDAVNAN